MTAHAKERAVQRYGIELTNKDIQNIISLIQDNKSYVLEGISNTMCFHIVLYNNVPYKVLYKRRRTGRNRNSQAKIITVYPFDVDEYNTILEKETQRLKDNDTTIKNAIKLLEDNGYRVELIKDNNV